MKNKTASVFWTGRSQAIRLPKEFRFEGETVLVRREGNAVILEPNQGWPEGYVHSFSLTTISFRLLESSCSSTHGLRSRKGKIEASMDRLLEPDLHDESIRFALHLLTNQDALFLFLDHPDLEATNHLAEKAIRPAVINRKTSGGNRTFNGAQAQAVIMTILRTAKLRAVSALDVLADILRSPQPLAHPLMR